MQLNFSVESRFSVSGLLTQFLSMRTDSKAFIYNVVIFRIGTSNSLELDVIYCVY